MLLPESIHGWSLTPKEAIALQKELAARVRVEPLIGPVRQVAGADLAFTPDGRRCLAGIVVWDLETQAVVEEALAVREVEFPYVPGLLSFRETPAVLAAAEKLTAKPDLFMFDAHGYAHPRRAGLASHAGMLLGRPSVGCAKSRLVGEHGEPGPERGDRTPLTHQGEVIGAVLRTRPRVRPVYVSVGDRVTLDDAIRVVLSCLTRYRLPEPTRRAHNLVTRERGKV